VFDYIPFPGKNLRFTYNLDKRDWSRTRPCKVCGWT